MQRWLDEEFLLSGMKCPAVPSSLMGSVFSSLMGFCHQAKQRWLAEKFLLSEIKCSADLSSLLGSVFSSPMGFLH
jgi:hypothetical protein